MKTFYYVALLLYVGLLQASEWRSLQTYTLCIPVLATTSEQQEKNDSQERSSCPILPFELFVKEGKNDSLVNAAGCFSFSLCNAEMRTLEKITVGFENLTGPDLYAKNQYAAYCMIEVYNNLYCKRASKLPIETLEELCYEEENKLITYIQTLHNFLKIAQKIKATKDNIKELEALEKRSDCDLSQSKTTLYKHSVRLTEKLRYEKEYLEKLESDKTRQPNPFAVGFLQECLIGAYAKMTNHEEPPTTPFIKTFLKHFAAL